MKTGVGVRHLGLVDEFAMARIGKAIFHNEIPSPTDVIIVCLINACDVLRYTFEIDEESEIRVEQIVKMLSLTGFVAEAVSDNIARPIFQRSAHTKQFPCVKLRKLGGQQ